MTASKTALAMRRKRKWNGIRFVTIDHPVLDSAAFTALSGAAAKALLLLLRRWYGPRNNNNGRLPLSVRDIKTYCHVRTDRAAEVQRELAASGLAEPIQKGAFSWKARQATTWRITFLPTASKPADWSFAKAESDSKNSEVGTRSGYTTVPAVGTDGPAARPKKRSSVPAVGTDSKILGTRSGYTSKVPPYTPPESAPRSEGNSAASPAPKPGTGGGKASRSHVPAEQHHQKANLALPRGRPSRVQCWPAAERKQLGLSQYALAERAGYTRGYIAGLEQGRHRATDEARERIGLALGASE